MGKVGPIIVFGVAIIICGIYWSMWEGSREYLNDYVVNDPYYALAYFLWDMIPIILILMGIMALVSAGLTSRRQKVYYE